MFFKRDNKTEYKLKKHEAKSKINFLVEVYSKKYSYTYNRVAIRNQRTRFGSCSSKRNLNFNWRIINLPDDIMEYVIKHELAHLTHMNHSKEFWNEVKKLDPNYKDHHKWIKQNGNRFLK